MIAGRLLNKVINIFTGLFGMATVVVMFILALNNLLPINFLGEKAITLGYFRTYFTLATVLCAGLEFTLKRNVILAAVFAAILIAVVVMTLYADFGVTF